jgi:hypothetical protein
MNWLKAELAKFKAELALLHEEYDACIAAMESVKAKHAILNAATLGSDGGPGNPPPPPSA